MSVGQILHRPPRSFHPGEFYSTNAGKGLQWRHVMLIVLAIVAAAIASVSLINDPPASPPPATSYLPSHPSSP